jgi:hypothetical protein
MYRGCVHDLCILRVYNGQVKCLLAGGADQLVLRINIYTDERIKDAGV